MLKHVTNLIQTRYHTFEQNIYENILLIFVLTISYQSFGQNSYRVESQIWNYTKPSEYISRVDNFEKDKKTGEEYIKKQNDGTTLSTDDKILFSIAKTDSTQVNIVLASYKGNGNIERFTLKGYAEKLGEYFKVNPKNDDSKIIVNVNVSELEIDQKKFYLISKTTNYTEQNYSYTSDYYVSEIEGKEFSITVIYDNETDKNKIEKSILESTFNY